MTVALLGFLAVILLAFSGVRIGIASLLVGLSGVIYYRGVKSGFALLGQQIVDDAMNYNFTVIPLFILMGVFIYHSQISDDLFNAAHSAFSRLKGGLAHSTVVACAGFSAVCGSSLATAATMTKIALPAMQRYKYSNGLAAGTIAAGGTLGIIIPPSVPLVIYGIVAEQDIGKLFIAGIIPGLLLVLSFMATIALIVRWKPDYAPSQGKDESVAVAGSAKGILPVLFLFILVLGGIYGSIFTPTEAAGIGAFGAALIALSRGYLRSVKDWRAPLSEAVMSTASIFMVIFGTLVFAQFINLSGLPYELVGVVERMDLSPTGLVICIALIGIAMGMVFDAIGILLLLVPVFLPVLIDADVNLIWFGIIVVLVSELGLITPPVGMNVFVVKATAPDLDLTEVFRGVIPFVFSILVVLTALIFVPAVVTVFIE